MWLSAFRLVFNKPSKKQKTTVGGWWPRGWWSPLETEMESCALEMITRAKEIKIGTKTGIREKREKTERWKGTSRGWQVGRRER